VLLETRGITKSYGSNRVLSDVQFCLEAGQSVAVIGENGAGKSTFAKILTGVIRPDNGSVFLEGRAAVFSSPHDALQQGIAFIPQELAYAPSLTVAENILLGRWPSWHGLTTHAAAIRRARAECEQFRIAVDVTRPWRR
jgi:ribose transport system ATP-binding protein